jgi:hypothetical protein
MREFFTVIGFVIAAVALVFGLTFAGYGLSSFFAPKYRALDNQVFKESEQYNDGMLRDLENIQMEYQKADASGKDALRSIALHRFSVYDEQRLPPNLRNFYNDLKAGK